jgi:pimeloyl-ACP methyl ester carboxylesterase
MGGDDDPIIPSINPRMQAQLIPSARLVLYRGGHLSILTEADELAPHIETFLNEHSLNEQNDREENPHE